MKKLLWIPCMMLTTVLSMAACGGSDDEPVTPERPGKPENPGHGDDDEEPETPALGGSRYLVLYCSRTGHTGSVAQRIRTTLDCDILEVEPRTPYQSDYDAMLDRAQEELAAIRQGNYPPIRTSVENFDRYDLIFAGYPVWHGRMATPMQTFLHEHASKLSGRRIALFATSGGSGITTSVSEARALSSGAVFTETLLLTSPTLPQTSSLVTAWLERIGASREEPDTPETSSSKINITVGSRTITATMEDHAAGRDFVSRLPLETTLNDYAGTEKIFYPSPALTTEGVTRGCAPAPGDIAIYAPWGNVAIFYQGGSHSNDLIRIGRIDGDGIGALHAAGDVKVRFESE